MTKEKDNKKNFPCRVGRLSRCLIPFLLLLIAEKSSHGYELSERYSKFGLIDSGSDPGAVYRTLQILESKGLIESRWSTEDPGPAKKIYSITGKGLKVLSEWAENIKERIETLKLFLKRYYDLKM